GTVPAVLLAVLVVIYGPRLAASMGWRPLLLCGYLTSVGWTLFLALVDGWQRGIAGRLTTGPEYLRDIAKVHSIPDTLREFTSHILTGSGFTWSIHVGAHPPGAFLIFVLLEKIGLGGGGYAGMLCILLGASAGIAVAVTLRALGHADIARSMLPFAVLAPGAIWVGVSADGMFAGILAWGVALLTVGAGTLRTGAMRWRDPLPAFAGGLLLGVTLYLSYGLALAGLIPLAVIAITRRWGVTLAAVLGAAIVVVAFTIGGFWWPHGLAVTRVDYAESIAETRPYSYFIWADLAALAFAIGPATVAGLRRYARAPRRVGAAPALLTGAAALAVLAADVSGMSKGEVERIWLPFAAWLIIPTALLPRPTLRYWLAAQALLALLVQHLLLTAW
ncbi:MAG: hypothetical protein ACRDQ1_18690, partial [Sciscionella sp.]